ncbi:MAG: hypothetical protein QOJ51_810 [Acidobacteriaceae bacterium]|jgi:hypothetical protein|nr:hypothetical protein [Acidobacteriaceae bacterium]
MCNAPSKWLRPAPLLVHVVRIEIPGLAGMKYDVSLGNGASSRASLRSHDVILEIRRVRHLFSPSEAHCPLAMFLRLNVQCRSIFFQSNIFHW